MFGHEPNSHFAFVPNQGQFHQNVKYRVDIPSGHLFIEDASFTYHFFDQQKLSRYHHGEIMVTKDEKLQHHAFKINWQETSVNKSFSETENFNYYLNYFLGKNQATGIYPAKSLWIDNFYDGIHLKWFANHEGLKYEFHVSQNQNPNKIKALIEGVKPKIEKGKLVLETVLGTIEEHQPIAYQIIKGKKILVDCNFQLKGNQLGFEVGKYNANYTLVIDPTLIFSTYSGSTSNNFGYTATFDSEGFLYSGSTVFGANGTYPTTTGAFQTNFKGGSGGFGGTDMGISKFTKDGTGLVYSTFIGGFADEMPHSLFVNTRDELYVFGTSGSFNYPVTANAYDTSFASGSTSVDLFTNNGLGVEYDVSCDLVVSRFSQDGKSLVASTFIGGSDNDGINNIDSLRYNYADEVRGEIEIDFEDNVYIATCTQSADFPMEGTPFQPTKGTGQDGVIMKLSGDLSTMIWSSFYGGNNEDALYSLAITSSGDIYVAGGTNSTDLPSFSNFFFQGFLGGRSDSYLGRISADGTTLQESSYLGTNVYDQSYFVELDRNENVYLLGQTESQGLAFIVNLDADSIDYLTYNAGQFIIKFNPELDSIHWSTRFGTDDLSRQKANPNISPTAFLVDLCNSIYLSGWGGATNQQFFLNNRTTSVDSMFITNTSAQQTTTDGNDFYLFVLSDDAQQVNYASYYGGNVSSEHVDGGTSRFDRKGKIYQAVCAGCGGNSDFPIFPANAFSADNNAGCNIGVFKMDFLLPLVVADFTIDEIACSPFQLQVNNTSLTQNSTQFQWNFGDGTFSNDTLPTKTFTAPGRYEVTLSLSDTNSCNLSDSIRRVIVIQEDTTTLLPNELVCSGVPFNSGLQNEARYSYKWVQTENVADSNLANTQITTDSLITMILLRDDGVCVDSILLPVTLDSVLFSTIEDSTLCEADTIQLSAAPITPIQFYLWSSQSNFSDTLNFFINADYQVIPSGAINKYYIRAINPNDCIAEDSVTIQLSQFSLKASDNQNLCLGDSIWLNAFSVNPLDALSFSWEPTGFILSNADSSSVLVAPPISRNYFVTSTNKANCQGLENVLVNVSTFNRDSTLLLASSDTVFLGKSATLEAFPSGFNYQWQNTTEVGQSVTVSPTATTTYTVEVYDPSNTNCKATATKTLFVKEIICDEPELFIPTGFTPNGDNLNDEFTIFGKNILEFSLPIYNRWGELVISLNNNQPTWDGTINGENAPEGVYYFDADVECIDNQRFYKKGDITLVR